MSGLDEERSETGERSHGEARAFQAPTGTRDILPPESARFAALVGRFAEICRLAGYGLVLSPLFEDVAVFRRSAGEESDIVKDEMYEFADKGGRTLALRPEGTASVVRAFVQHRPTVPWKTWYVTPAFRYERPQAGRYRQHHQVGVEVLGTADADCDVEVIALLHDLLAAVGLRRLELKLNSMGDENCMPAYRAALVAALSEVEGDLCAEHQKRWDKNPLRVLDCKKPECRAVRHSLPRLVDALCDPCRDHLERVQAGLDALGISFAQDDFLVRGFDYYTRTTFEFAALALDAAQNAVGGGGRYDGLVAQLGGPPTAGIGFGAGIERILLACDAEEALADVATGVDVFVVDLTGGDAARDLAHRLRRGRVATDRGFGGRSLKAQLKLADRSGARLAVIVGAAEKEAGTVTLRDLRDAAHRQAAVPLERLVEDVRAWLSDPPPPEHHRG